MSSPTHEQQNVIRDAAVLEDEFVPNDVVHRNQEMNVLTRALDPLTRSESPETAMLFGPSGTGKTCLAKFAVRELKKEVPVQTQYVDCWRDYTRFQALYQVLEGVPATTNVRSTLSTEELLSRLRDLGDQPLVVILDEVDELHEPEVIGDLQRTRGVSVVLIANEQDELFAKLRPKTISRLRGTEQAQFDRYGIDDLVAILAARAERGLRPNVVDREQLRRIADGVAGDARVGMTALRRAAHMADDADEDVITESVVEEAVESAKIEVRRSHADRLQPDQRVLYGIIVEYNGISPGDLHDEYVAREGEDAKSERTMREYLKKLLHYNLIEARGSGPSREYIVAY